MPFDCSSSCSLLFYNFLLSVICFDSETNFVENLVKRVWFDLHVDISYIGQSAKIVVSCV